MTDGSMVQVDEAYLRESIVDPNANIVQGFAALMPGTFGGSLSDQQIDVVIAYIKSLQ